MVRCARGGGTATQRDERCRSPSSGGVHGVAVRCGTCRGLPHGARVRTMNASTASGPGGAVSPLRARHRADGHRDDEDRRGTREPWLHGARGDLAAVVPPSRHRPGLERPTRPPGGHVVGFGHSGASVPGERQDEPAAPGARLPRLLGVGRGAVSASRGVGETRGRRHRHVAAADPRADRLDREPPSPGPARLQHPGRLPRRRRRDGSHHQSPRDSCRRVARTCQLPGVRCGHRAVRRPPRQRRGEDASGGR